MLEFRQQLKTNLSKKKLMWISISSMCLKHIEKFFNWKIKVSWKVKNWIIFVSPTPIYWKTEIFRYKIEIIRKLNQKLKKIWCNQTIKDIRIK